MAFCVDCLLWLFHHIKEDRGAQRREFMTGPGLELRSLNLQLSALSAELVKMFNNPTQRTSFHGQPFQEQLGNLECDCLAWSDGIIRF